MSRQTAKTTIIVRDNGMGRKQSRALETKGTGKGLISLNSTTLYFSEKLFGSLGFDKPKITP